MWEDRTNKEGGRWLLILKKKEGLLDNSWTETVSMCCYACTSASDMVSSHVHTADVSGR